jgi:hypothetical protein
MTGQPNAETHSKTRPAAQQDARRWLLLVHQLPSTPSNLRVRTWRRLQQLGAIAVKQAVYVLPDSPAAREDFEWLKTEIEGAGGEASVFAANSVDSWSDDRLVEEFRRSCQQRYRDLAGEVEQALGRVSVPRRRPGTRAPASRRLLEGFRQTLTAIEAVDFFGSAGRDRVALLIEQFDERLSTGSRTPAAPAGTGTHPRTYQGRLWVTRPRPGVDRMSSAWLIRRFIDPDARFGFAQDREAVPREGVPFDMFSVELSHQGDDCTFETLCKRFEIRDPAVGRLAEIVHDLDLKDGRFGAPEASAIATIIDGLQLAYADDDALLAQGIILFDALHRAFERSLRKVGPRPVARTRKRARQPRARKSS